MFSRVHGACRCRNRDNSYQASGARGKRTLHPGPRLVFLDLDPQDLNTHSWRDPALPHTHTFPQAEFYAIPLRIPGVLLHRCTESRARVLVPDLEIIPSWEHGGIIQGNWSPPPRTRKYPCYRGSIGHPSFSTAHHTDFSSFYILPFSPVRYCRGKISPRWPLSPPIFLATTKKEGRKIVVLIEFREYGVVGIGSGIGRKRDGCLEFGNEKLRLKEVYRVLRGKFS